MASETVNMICSKGMEVVVPDICIGELVDVIGRKSMKIDLELLLKELRRGKLVVGHVNEEGMMRYANFIGQVRAVDEYPESSDVRILAFSMADRNCLGLLTFERKLIESAGLQRFIARHMAFKKGYVITDYPFKH